MVPDPKDVETIDPYMLAVVTSISALWYMVHALPCTC